MPSLIQLISMERPLRMKEIDKSFAAKLRDVDTEFRGMLDEISPTDSSAVTREEFSKWWKQIGSEVQQQQREQQRQQQQQQQQSGELGEPEYELEVSCPRLLVVYAVAWIRDP
jgi:Flp pilus assembly protein TadB